MIRRSQEGYISRPKKNKRGEMFIEIRYRIPARGGKSIQKSERLYDVDGRKAARKILDDRLEKYSAPNARIGFISFAEFVKTHWKPHLEQQRIKRQHGVGMTLFSRITWSR